MKDLLLRCYPWAPAERIRVLPWGAWTDEASSMPVESLDVPEDARVLLTRQMPNCVVGNHAVERCRRKLNFGDIALHHICARTARSGLRDLLSREVDSRRTVASVDQLDEDRSAASTPEIDPSRPPT